MFERFKTPEEAFNWQLGAALTMERNIVGMLDELVEETHDERIARALREHQAQTRGHVENVERAFTMLGWEVDDSPCPTIEAIEKEGKANIKKSDDAVVDPMILSGAVETEHHEIAVYENLITAAQGLGRDDVADLLSRNLAEEQTALEKVTGFARELAMIGA